MAPTNAEFMKGIIHEEFLGIALGALQWSSELELDDKAFLKVSWIEELWSSSVSSWSMTSYVISWAYTRKTLLSTIASGATPIGSAERAPDDIYWLSIRDWRSIGVLLPSGASFMVVETRIFSVKIWLRHKILELRYRNTTRMPWLVTKVRPRDPSCVAWYTHMDALCWYVSVSMTRRKSWWTHWVPWEPLGFILCKS
jgi:hypothetical protein